MHREKSHTYGIFMFPCLQVQSLLNVEGQLSQEGAADESQVTCIANQTVEPPIYSLGDHVEPMSPTKVELPRNVWQEGAVQEGALLGS